MSDNHRHHLTTGLEDASADPSILAGAGDMDYDGENPPPPKPDPPPPDYPGGGDGDDLPGPRDNGR